MTVAFTCPRPTTQPLCDGAWICDINPQIRIPCENMATVFLFAAGNFRNGSPNWKTGWPTSWNIAHSGFPDRHSFNSLTSCAQARPRRRLVPCLIRKGWRIRAIAIIQFRKDPIFFRQDSQDLECRKDFTVRLSR